MADIKVRTWVEQSHKTEDYRKLFLNMDLTMKYIHSKGYGITNFSPDNITLIDGQVEKVLFENIDNVLVDYRKEVIKNNVYGLATLAIGTYSNCLAYLNPEFLKSNFKEFEQFLPVEDIPYYKGVTEKGSVVYYSDYVNQYTKREISNSAAAINGKVTEGPQESSGNSNDKGKTYTKSTEAGKLYAQLDDSVAAFVNLYIFPAIIITLSLLIPLIAWVFALTK